MDVLSRTAGHSTENGHGHELRIVTEIDCTPPEAVADCTGLVWFDPVTIDLSLWYPVPSTDARPASDRRQTTSISSKAAMFFDPVVRHAKAAANWATSVGIDANGTDNPTSIPLIPSVHPSIHPVRSPPHHRLPLDASLHPIPTRMHTCTHSFSLSPPRLIPAPGPPLPSCPAFFPSPHVTSPPTPPVPKKTPIFPVPTGVDHRQTRKGIRVHDGTRRGLLSRGIPGAERPSESPCAGSGYLSIMSCGGGVAAAASIGTVGTYRHGGGSGPGWAGLWVVCGWADIRQRFSQRSCFSLRNVLRERKREERNISNRAMNHWYSYRHTLGPSHFSSIPPFPPSLRRSVRGPNVITALEDLLRVSVLARGIEDSYRHRGIGESDRVDGPPPPPTTVFFPRCDVM
ncbi:hypothetical protein BZA05DRAFT_184614 [Tricharina praecox]|uniref:uncharacterized protein n=1 Tax=Tricharina praecox TaxID=43433 RepID=UPI00221F54D3|nr:uncharacterized protein BZA05DRAFT_184614 [Tricharina praecox]KAI5843251.1 hypothetical protein BZA05DRAFT_184614 [Tricharina praecox]